MYKKFNLIVSIISGISTKSHNYYMITFKNTEFCHSETHFISLHIFHMPFTREIMGLHGSDKF